MRRHVTSRNQEPSLDCGCHIAMSVLTCIMLVALCVDKSGAAVRPVVTFTPHWENILSGDRVALTCDGGPAFLEKQRYYWYKDYDQLDTDQKNITIHSAARKDTGNYQCQTMTSDLSGSYYLYISPENIILQRPQSVIEGLPLTLRCHTRSVYTIVNTTFYMENRVIQSSVGDSELYVERVNGDGIQQYKCSKVVQDVDGFLHTLSADYCVYVNGAAANFTSVVTLTPDWRPVLFGDVVVILCDAGSSAPEHQRYYWYKDCRQIDVDLQNITIRSASYNDAGDYQCKTSTSDTSDPVTLEVSRESIILQGPESVYEGSPLTLRCHIRSGYNVTTTTFYKGDEKIDSTVTDSILHIHSLYESGPYRCGKEIQDGASSTILSAFSFIEVIKFFYILEIKVSSCEMTEGIITTLKCVTKIRPAAGRSRLKFAFYRDGQNVQNFTSSDTYRLQAYDLGRYTCEVLALPERAKKMSKVLVIPVSQEEQDYTLQNTIRLVVSGLILMTAAGFIFYHNKPVCAKK